jgi:hypothetical protein
MKNTKLERKFSSLFSNALAAKGNPKINSEKEI